MRRRLPWDDRHKTVPGRRRSSFCKETAYDPESLGAETRQACDLEGVGAGARQFSKFKDTNSDIIRKAQSACSLYIFLK